MDDKSIFIGALNDVFESEMTEYLAALPIEENPEYSRNYNMKMRKLIKRQRKPYFKLISTAGRRVACIIVAIIVFSASAMSVKAIREAVFDFITKIFSDHNVVTVESGTDIGYPETIETEYFISALPSGFEQVDYGKTDYSIDIIYFCDNDYVFFSQFTKTKFEERFDNEHTEFSTINIDMQEYLFLDNGEDYIYVWDNGEYILQIRSNLNKEAIANLCKSTKVK